MKNNIIKTIFGLIFVIIIKTHATSISVPPRGEMIKKTSNIIECEVTVQDHKILLDVINSIKGEIIKGQRLELVLNTRPIFYKEIVFKLISESKSKSKKFIIFGKLINKTQMVLRYWKFSLWEHSEKNKLYIETVLKYSQMSKKNEKEFLLFLIKEMKLTGNIPAILSFLERFATNNISDDKTRNILYFSIMAELLLQNIKDPQILDDVLYLVLSQK